MAGKDDGIMDILDTPDVAVWAKGIRKGADVPSDRVREPSKIASMTLRIVSSGKSRRKKEKGELMVDPANREEMEKVSAAHASLTDESGYAKQEQ
ncbi:hypothetical protein [Nitrososphaera viennensis]|uniref:Uncharacterized protein n=2 Tax=Nitrososphaera viennensis TaxID=1034015 RepID=A0A060HNI9_9ARCH|nr:hypothetical protein [Nitrososphaera viennensis]AIC16725.1 hypothetical protein NVIE_024620 [Nitrososphaera viennensis EN76]UVS68644.1 hypothetical protein NWT39_12145 [Nitrososphaera viennensis]